ncbi:MAG: hypothetical protein JO028_12235 [Acidobacteriaceae bacterium]|nr:hypothetical protein [Acidobacteriaceae bacterium]
MPLEPGVLDANILIYAVNTSAPQHLASRRLLEAALDPAITPASLVSQDKFRFS